MTHEEMADVLRKAGWMVSAPVDPNAKIPELQVGQVWVGGGSSRQITAIIDGRVIYTSPGVRDGCPYIDIFREWVRKTGARPRP